MRFATVKDVLEFADTDTGAYTYARDLAHDYDADPDQPSVILECFENEALVQEEMTGYDADGNPDGEDSAHCFWWGGRLRAYAYMLRALGVTPTFIDWKGESE